MRDQPPTPPTADRNLLFGILALQMDFISREALLAAMHAWVLAKEKPLGQILREQGALSDADRSLLDIIVRRHLELHENDAEKSLAVVSSIKSVRQDLEQLGDPDVDASLGVVASAPGRSPESTIDDVKQAGLRYRILRPHAKGGLGKVYVAEDQELHREVALKEIQPAHADNPQSRGRFLLEAEITGGLEHPGIVPVYGLGQYDDGRPFYAMRFIKGDNLKEAIRRFHEADQPGRDPGERSLALRQLLRRFVDVCNAVAYAHSRGVLHRDLKPGNIMLGKYGETLIIDWGLAKPGGTRPTRSVSEAIDEGTLYPSFDSGIAATQMGSAIGTPGYTSPEQALGHLDRLGPGSDVYSLGATLYALLTGQAPFPEREVADVLEKVRHGDFPRPRQIKPAVRPALEAVCLKAMALKPEERYATPLELAADVEHWLADEPVAAYPEPWTARLRRWGRRHRPLITSAAAVLVGAALLAGTTLLLSRAYENERQAKLQEASERTRAEENEKAATEREAETKAVLQFVEKRVFAAARPEALGYKVTLRQAVEEALPFVAKGFTDQPLIEARLRLTLGTSFGYLGDAKTAAEQHEAARALYTQHRGPDHPDTLASMHNLATSYYALGRHSDALKLFEETLALMKAKLGPDHPNTLASMGNLANSYRALGRYADALKLFEETLALRKAKLGPDHPDTLKSMHNLASSYDALGRYADALKLREETLALRKAKLGPDHPERLGNAEVDHLGHRLAIVSGDQHIGRLEVTVNHAFLVGVLHGLANVGE
jgi:serine/threonine protein kinase